MTGYQLNFVAMQFDFSQFLPKSLIPKEESAFVATNEPDEEWLHKCLNFFKKKALYLFTGFFSK